MTTVWLFFFFFSSRRRHTRLQGDWSSDVCSSDLKYSVSHSFRRNTKTTQCSFAFFILGSHDRMELCTQFHSVITLLLNFADFTLKCKSRVSHGDMEVRNGVQYRQIYKVGEIMYNYLLLLLNGY